MKIAAVSDDGTTICAHFGKAQLYVVLTMEDGKIVSREVRDRSNLIHPSGSHGDQGGHSHGHGHDHSAMAAAISDCSALLAGGMGRPAYAGLKAAGVEPVVTDILDIDSAAEAFARGEITNRLDRLH